MTRSPERLRIVVSGMVASVPGQGGATWAVLQYVLGFKRLGHDVLLVEPLHAELRPSHARLADVPAAAYFQSVIDRFDLGSRAALVDETRRETVGLSYDAVRRFIDSADVLFNLSGTLRDGQLMSNVPIRVFLDLDPAFNQMWHSQGVDLGFCRHNRFVTIGINIGTPDCPVPTCGVHWITSPQPLVLDRWPACNPSSIARPDTFTTIANWRGYGSIEYEGRVYGQKAHSLRRVMELPRLVPQRFDLALSIHAQETRDREALAANGWSLTEPATAAGDVDAYRTFVQSSWAEFGIAKSGYVDSRCGWFSDRSVCYLASSRPVLAQDTAFGTWLPTGDGAVPFATVEDAAAGAASIAHDYHRHARAARALVHDYFDSDRVLHALLDRVDVGS